MATATVDTAYLAASLTLPESTLETLLVAPTVELVITLLQQVEAKARDFDNLKAEKLRADVELETAVRNGDARSRSLKASVDKGLQEIEELRKKLHDEETTNASLRNELQTIRSSSSDHSAEIQSLQSRISSLEASNRETLALLEAKSTAHDRLADELSAQQQKIIALRREISELEEKNQSLQNAASSTKFREQALEQEIDLLKKSNEWHETELQTKSAEYLKFRKEKGAKIAELQRINEDATQTIESLKRTESHLRNRVEEMNHKIEQSALKVQELQDAAAKSEETFRVQLDSVQRLADLQKQSADTARARLQEVQSELDQLNERAAEEVGRLQAELETEHSQKEAAEERSAQLEAQIERLEMEVAGRDARSGPTTPRRSMNGAALATPGNVASPRVFTPGSSRLKSSVNMSQLLSEHTELRAQLDAEKRRNAKLSSAFDDVLHELESKQPELEELRAEHEQLKEEVLGMSNLLDEATKSRDKANKDARKWEGQLNGSQRENELLRQQLRDLSAQVRVLLTDIQARDQGLEALTEQQRIMLERAASGKSTEEIPPDMSEVAKYISQHLVVYRNVAQLQEQNAKHLRIIRELGEEKEGEEARAKQKQQEEDRAELARLRENCAQLEDEIQILKDRSKSFIKERDMFRRMLSHRGPFPPGSEMASMFAQSVDGRVSTPPPAGSMQGVEQSPNGRELADYAKLIKEMQSHMDAIRQEATEDRQALKQQVDRLAKEKSEIQAEIARASSQLQLAQERYELLKSNFDLLKQENGEYQKRTQTLAEVAAKQDLRTQQVAEELVEAKALVDGLRNEAAGLKAEKDLWKKVETRLSEDNRALLDERARLNKMITDLQNLQNEREHSDAETRRRLQNRADALEAELATVKRKLDEEMEDSKKAMLRREYEQEQNRTRIDDLVKSVTATKEELVAVKTQRDQLQARVEEMKIELRNAEERAQALQPRPTARSDEASTTADSDALNREQELAVEIADLKRDLEYARADLESAKQTTEKYQAIAQAAEEDLQNFTETSDQYREETDKALAEKDARIRDLEQRVEEISAEISNTNTELNNIRKEQEDSTIRFEEQKAMLESEIARLKDDNERFKETARLHQDDLKVQAEIAQQAQQNYENELIKHAEASQTLQKVRAEYNELKLEVAGAKAEAEASRTMLAQNEETWAETKERYERELNELRLRREDVLNQNRILHEQLETVTSQIASLKQDRATTGEDSSEASPSAKVESLQEVIRYLRREKEIVDVQYELGIQEAKRLKQQLEQTRSQLEQTREKLNEERQNQADKEQNAMSHSKLMETLNELNLYRESNATLRNENTKSQEQLARKVMEVEDLRAQIEPLRARVYELENDIELKNGEIKLLQEDRDRWQQRAQNILQKYDRIDPEELEALKGKIEVLQTERDQLIAEKQPLQEQVNSFEQRIRSAVEEETAKLTQNINTIKEQAISKNRKQNSIIAEKSAQIEALSKEKNELSSQLNQIQADLKQVESTRDELLSQLGTREAELQEAKTTIEKLTPKATPQEDATMQDDHEQGEVDERGTNALAEENSTLKSQLVAAEARANEESSKAAALQLQVESLQARVQELESQVAILQDQQNNMANSTQPQSTPADAEAMETLTQELAAARSEIEKLRQDAAIAASVSNSINPDGNTVPETSTTQPTVAQAELEARYEEKVKEAEERFNRRAEAMRAQLSKKLGESRERLKQENQVALEEMRAQHEEATRKLKAEHEAEIQRIKAEHEQELEQVRKESQQRSAAATLSSSDPTSVKSEHPKLEGWEPSDREVMDFIQNNTTVKSIVARNISTKLNKEKEELIAKTKEEQERIAEEKLEELRKASEKQKQAAVEMESKRQSVKLNLAENKFRKENAKLEVVKRAAETTPQRPVGEVWAIAKDAKPVIPTPAPSNAQQSPSVQAPNPVQAQGAAGFQPQQQPGDANQVVQNKQQEGPQGSQPRQPQGGPATANTASSGQSSISSFGRPSGLPAPQQINPFANVQSNLPRLGNNPFGQQLGQQQAQRPISPANALQQNIPQPSQGPGIARPPNQQHTGNALGAGRGAMSNNSHIPAPGVQGMGRAGRGGFQQNQPNIGQGMQQGQGLQQQRQPFQQSQLPRGNANIARGGGRGAGRGRGGNQNQNFTADGPRAQQPPANAPPNAAAGGGGNQQQSGQKRQRDDDQNGGDAKKKRSSDAQAQ